MFNNNNHLLPFIGGLCSAISLACDFGSYYRQIKKTLRTKHSNQISAMAYMMKIAKITFNMVGLAIFSNWLGFGMELGALLICVTAFLIVVRYKPRGWRLFK